MDKTKKQKNNYLGLRIDPEMREKLVDYSVEDRRTLSNMVKVIFEKYIINREGND